LKFAEAITIHSKRTLNGLKGLPWFLLETVMVQNSSIYDELEKYMNDNLSPQTHVYDGDTDDGDDNDKEARGSCGSKIGIASLHVYILAASACFSGCEQHLNTVTIRSKGLISIDSKRFTLVFVRNHNGPEFIYL
jgi:hypothetical protein